MKMVGLVPTKVLEWVGWPGSACPDIIPWLGGYLAFLASLHGNLVSHLRSGYLTFLHRPSDHGDNKFGIKYQ